MASWITEKDELNLTVGLLVEGLSSIREALGSTPSTTQLQSQDQRGETRGSQVQVIASSKPAWDIQELVLKEKKNPLTTTHTFQRPVGSMWLTSSQ